MSKAKSSSNSNNNAVVLKKKKIIRGPVKPADTSFKYQPKPVFFNPDEVWYHSQIPVLEVSVKNGLVEILPQPEENTMALKAAQKWLQSLTPALKELAFQKSREWCQIWIHTNLFVQLSKEEHLFFQEQVTYGDYYGRRKFWFAVLDIYENSPPYFIDNFNPKDLAAERYVLWREFGGWLHGELSDRVGILMCRGKENTVSRFGFLSSPYNSSIVELWTDGWGTSDWVKSQTPIKGFKFKYLIEKTKIRQMWQQSLAIEHKREAYEARIKEKLLK